jgi:REP element-mobilizing transposase RayT
MTRKARAEVAVGLYHVITRGNNRRPIFNAPADYEAAVRMKSQTGVIYEVNT